jgi:MHS family shikimate/dehydroshikimate transporter-like MFS transporter
MTAHNSTPTSIRKVAVASLVGNALEWYDFFLYGTAAALVFNTLFFPTFDPLVGTIAAFSTYAVGFAARPFGGLIFGHYGDRLGRKSMLVITLIMMGVAMFLIGVLPTYAQIGVWAPVLLVLLRVVQGVAVGGEWGGGVLLVSEHAPNRRRGFYSAWSQTGVGLGFVLSALVYATVTALTSNQAFLTWGWRVPFLVGIALTAVGLVIRMRILETPAFEQVKSSHQEAKLPIIEALRTHPKSILVTMGARVAENGSSYIFLVFALAYAAKGGLDRQVMLTAVLVASAFEVLAMPAFGALSVQRRDARSSHAVADARSERTVRAVDPAAHGRAWA